MATGPVYMNATPHHSKIRVSLSLSSSLFIAGQDVTGKMEMECRADKDVGLGLIMVELFAIQELNSRDHSASSTFLHSRRLFQGPGLPPSNAVDPYPVPGESFPQGHFPARRGITTFFFRFRLPLSSPSTVSFASGLAKLRYEVRASVGVAHRGEKRVVTDVIETDVVQCEDMDGIAVEHVVVGENGKMYVQGQVVGGRIVSGQQACLELRVRNHSPRKTTGLSLTLTRVLHLNNSATTSQAPVQLSDSLCSQSFRGVEYCVQAGTEGVANLVFDVPKAARVVKGGIREGIDDDEGGRRRTEPLFEIRCILGVKVGMGIGHKDVVFEMPVQLSHPATLPEDTPSLESYTPPMADPSAVAPNAFHRHPNPGTMSPVFHPPNPYFTHSPGPEAGTSSPPYPYVSPPIPSLSASPPQQYFYPSSPYAHSSSPHQRLWSPPLSAVSPLPYYIPGPHQTYYYPPTVPLVPFAYPGRPNSAGAGHSHTMSPAPGGLPSGLPGVEAVGPVHPSFHHHQQQPDAPFRHLDPQPEEALLRSTEAEEGKGERASRISNHLRISTRARSMSPTSHRFPAGSSVPPPTALTLDTANTQRHGGPPVLSPRPMISPRSSFTADPALRHNGQEPHGTTKSGRVDLLERMVDPAPGEEGKSVKDVLDDLQRVEKDIEIGMTSPTPSAPSGKPELLRKVPKASEIFELQPVDQKIGEPEERAVKSILRPSPMARRISISDKERQLVGALRPKPEQHSDGLDALERRLLLEVGTRKPGAPERPTVFELGLTATSTAPRSINASTPAQAGDSEISSLALASNGSTDLPPYLASPAGATIIPAGDNVPAGLHVNGRGKVVTNESKRGDTNEDRSSMTRKERLSEEKAKEQEAIKLRKAAKGRVADWLGGVATQPGPDEVVVSGHDSQPLRRISGPENASEGLLSGKRSVTRPMTLLSPPTPIPKPDDSPPNAKTSRTLSVADLRNGSTSPLPDLTSSTKPAKSDAPRGRPLSKSVTDPSILPRAPATSPSPYRRKPVPPLEETAVETETSKSSPAQPVPSLDETVTGEVSTSNPVSELERGAQQLTKSPHLQSVPETKYDVRSARGGRGGITTSVAAIWASLKQEEEKGDQPIRPPKSVTRLAATRPTSLDVGRSKASQAPNLASPNPTRHDAPPLPVSMTQPPQTRNMVKSASDPATVVPSHAKPYLSSTASLARLPTVAMSKAKPPALISTLRQYPSGDSTSKGSPVSLRDMGFGQARLKQLIQKYQESPS